ncbi:hypothetical protein ABT185_07655 [Streptomyces clavifer]|uniref:hypothetical protein n=1 Tax=Streptomyces clavifer TaxID=68188 RepID=UPI0033235CCC
MADRPIIPTRIFPAGTPLPTSGHLPAAPAPPPPPPPPLSPPVAPPGGEWWRPPPQPAPMAVPPPIHIYIDPSAWLPATEPEPRPSWWARCRPGYNLACILVGLPLTSGWAGVLVDVRDEASLAGAWVMATIPLAIVAVADNHHRIAARSHPDLWMPRARAAGARVLFGVTTLGAATALPIATIVYAITGVRS